MFFRLTAFLSCLLLLGACSQSELPTPAGEEEGKVHLSVTFVTPKGNASRSATNNDGGTEEGVLSGESTENHITSAWVLMASLPGGATTPTEIHSVHPVTQLYPSSDSQWVGELRAAPGNYRLLVVANPSDALKTTLNGLEGKPWTEAIHTAVEAATYADLSQTWEDNAFLMTNAYTGNLTQHDVHLLPGSRDNAVTIDVQRACARFDYQATRAGNAYVLGTSSGDTTPDTGGNTPGADGEETPGADGQTYADGAVTVDGQNTAVTVTLTDARLMNVSRGFHLFKLLCNDENGLTPTPYAHETPINYVLDTDWTAKTNYNGGNASELFFNPLGNGNASEGINYQPLPTETGNNYTKLFYGSENTLPGISRQINGLSTAVVFKGYFTLKDNTATELYCLENKQQIYTSLEQLKNSNSEFTSLSNDATDAQLAAAGIRHYTAETATGGNGTGDSGGSGDTGTGGSGTEIRFPVWYTYWNRHNDNNNPVQMGIMEFAVVRNNVYQMQVNSIHFLGLPQNPADPENPWTPKGDTPDELGAQIDVTVTVASWVDRTYDYDI